MLQRVLRLLAMSDKPKGTAALHAAWVVSGFDQEIEDPEDEKPDRRWEDKQFPRQGAILRADDAPRVSRPGGIVALSESQLAFISLSSVRRLRSERQ